MTTTAPRRRGGGDDHGATTVVFSLVVLVLFAVAALGVELTNLYARDRAVQTSADLAAFAGAQGLPDTCEAFAQALENLHEDDNAVQDDDGDRDFSVVATAAAMSNGISADGEIEVLRRHTPGTAVTGADRLATSACSGVPTGADTQAGPGRVVRVTTPGRTVAFTFANVFSVFPGGEPASSAEVRAQATVGLTGPDGATVLPVFLPSGCVQATGGPAVLTVGPAPEPAPPVVPVFQPPGADGPTVTGPPPPPGDCEGSTTVRLGLLDLPGAEGSRARAFVDGVRPTVASFATPQLPLLDTPCMSAGTPPGAVLTPQDGATCLPVLDGDVSDVGRQALVTTGLLTGVGSAAGRLASPVATGCSPPGGVPDRTDLAGTTVSNTTLSCYLATRPDGSRSGLEDVLAGAPGSLDQRVFSDPRFALVPVLGVTARPEDGSWPVAMFRGVFITDETPGSPATCSSGTDCNGIVLDGTGSQVREVRSLTFPTSALPVSLVQEGNGVAWVAGTKDFLLLE